MDKFAEYQAVEFFKWNVKEIKVVLEFLKKMQDPITAEELIKALTTFENSNTSARYNLFLSDQRKKSIKKK